jgi:hypothetical protein
MTTQDAYHSIGEPFLVCPKCNSINIIADNRTEWDLKPQREQFLFKAKVAFFSAFLGFGTGVLLTELSKRYLHLDSRYWFTAPIGAIAWYFLLGADLRRKIRESRSRMLDPKYKELLARLGLSQG